MRPDLAAFQPVQLGDRAHFAAIRLGDFSPHVLNFTNLICWQHKYRYRWGTLGDRIAVHNQVLGCMIVDDIESIPPARLADWHDRYYLVPPDYPQRHPDTHRYFTVASFPRDQQDYIYDLDRLARLDDLGAPRQRTYLRQFSRNFSGVELRELDAGDRGQCDDLYRRWLTGKPTVESPDWEHAAFQTAWDHYDSLGLAGLGLYCDEAMAAFLLYDPLTPRTLVGHFAKSDYAVRSSGTALLWLAARDLRERFDYLNFAQDIGMPGLRRYKQSLQPLAVTGFLKLVRH